MTLSEALKRHAGKHGGWVWDGGWVEVEYLKLGMKAFYLFNFLPFQGIEIKASLLLR